jgi:hypothetical protein
MKTQYEIDLARKNSRKKNRVSIADAIAGSYESEEKKKDDKKKTNDLVDAITSRMKNKK